MEPGKRCAVCRQTRGGWGNTSDNPPPLEWDPVSRISDVPWVDAARDWFRCRICEQWWYQSYDPREQWTSWRPLDDSVALWFEDGLTLAGLIERSPDSPEIENRWQELFRAGLEQTESAFNEIVEAIWRQLEGDGGSLVGLSFTTLRDTITHAARGEFVPPKFRALYESDEEQRRERFEREGRPEGWTYEVWVLQFPLERFRGAGSAEDALIRVMTIDPVTRWLRHRIASRVEAAQQSHRFVEIEVAWSLITHPRLRHLWWMPDEAWETMEATLDPVARFDASFQTLIEGAERGDAEGWEACIAAAFLLEGLLRRGSVVPEEHETSRVRGLIAEIDPDRSFPSRHGNLRGLPLLTGHDVRCALEGLLETLESAD
ncbi:MAG: hypothetical protein KY432_08785 [Acidobacteria bacterium]|nr:hypothetical protein [Acidobacteriota bacterium]